MFVSDHLAVGVGARVPHRRRRAAAFGCHGHPRPWPRIIRPEAGLPGDDGGGHDACDGGVVDFSTTSPRREASAPARGYQGIGHP